MVAAGIAVAGLVLTLAFLPSKKAISKVSGVEAVKGASSLNPTGPLLAEPTAERGAVKYDGIARG